MNAIDDKPEHGSLNNCIDTLKVALIGNMNNNNFALMRYMRDLGVDAHLLLCAHEHHGSLAHFSPINDTWNIIKWEKYIHQTSIPNAPIAALSAPLSWLIGVRSWIKELLGIYSTSVSPVSSKEIALAYAGYDMLIGSGITPATLLRIDKSLDIFYPYSGRVEYLETAEFANRILTGNWLESKLLTFIKERQTVGIKRARNVLNADAGVTQQSLKAIGVRPKILGAPIVYNLEELPLHSNVDYINKAFNAIGSCSISIMHHSRVLFSNDGKYEESLWEFENKHSDWILIGFAAALRLRPDINMVLIMVDYGPDVDAAKFLASELGITDHIVWLPKMGRRELMLIISRVSICCGEFYGYKRMLWGGAGWEALASGKPLLQGFNFDDGEFEEVYGHPPPSMLPVRHQDDILHHLLDMIDHSEKMEEIGRGAKEWFNRHNGIGLAKQWLDIMMASRTSEGNRKNVTVDQDLHG